MTRENSFGGGLWRWLVTGIGVISTLVGGIFWLSRVEYTAEEALAISRDNKTEIEKIRNETQQTREILLEVRNDLKWLRERLK